MISARTFSHPYLLLTLTAMLWGGNAVAGKFAVGHISPFLLTTMRWFFAALFILPFAWPHLRRELPGLKPHLPFMLALAIIGFTIFNNLMYIGLHYTSAINIGILQASMPLMVFVLNFLIYRVKATGLQIFGFMLALVGVAVTTTRGDLSTITALNFNIGDLLMLSAILCYGIYSVALTSKPQMHWMTFIAIIALAAFATSLPLAIWEYLAGDLIWPDQQGALAMIYTAIFPALVAQVLWMIGLEQIGANRGGVFINIVPISSTAFAILLLGETLHYFHIVSILLVVGGIALAQKQSRPNAT